MVKSLILVFIFFNCLLSAFSQTEPVITSWAKSTGRGYNNILTNVQQVSYSTSYVYIKTASIPSYSIGPWSMNPNTPTDQNFIFKLPRTPQVQPGAKAPVPLGHIGVWSNGVSVFNAEDAQSYNNLGVWKRNAFFFEKVSFDSCNGHPAPNGEYHHHVNPVCIHDTQASSKHSPLIGYAFDGYPIYGPYGYSNPLDKNSAIKRIATGYRTRSITTRDSLANGTVLSSTYYGPAISTQYPLGSFIQDYEYVSGLGDLDQYNGRFGITPEYPSGTYAYFVTIDSAYQPVYPYIVGPSYYGVPVRNNMGPTGGKEPITEPVTSYYAYTA